MENIIILTIILQFYVVSWGHFSEEVFGDVADWCK